jgi:hypothetical protein
LLPVNTKLFFHQTAEPVPEINDEYSSETSIHLLMDYNDIISHNHRCENLGSHTISTVILDMIPCG